MVPKDIKVVILGQDPYIKEGQAIGLAFAVPNDKTTPPSLRIIEEELGHKVAYKDLHHWVNQGVFLFNTALTVERGHSGSHIPLWNEFTLHVIEIISSLNPGVIWLLWGKYAQAYTKYIANMVYEYPREDEIDKNIVLIAAHPAAEVYRRGAGFIGCNHFNKVNDILKMKNLQTIDW